LNWHVVIVTTTFKTIFPITSNCMLNLHFILNFLNSHHIFIAFHLNLDVYHSMNPNIFISNAHFPFNTLKFYLQVPNIFISHHYY